MHPKLKPFLYGMSVFAIYILLIFVLRYFSNYNSTDAEFFGFFSTNDILLGVVVAVVLTFTHERKKNIK